MPNTREKLIELLAESEYMSFERKADHLIANGVRLEEKQATSDESKWISVNDRLPEKNVLVLCIGARGGMFLGISPTLFSDGTAYFGVPNARNGRYATYWMLLPEPPKGE